MTDTTINSNGKHGDTENEAMKTNDRIGSPTVLIAGQNKLSRDILAKICEMRGLAVLGETTTVEGLVQSCFSLRPDVVIAADRLGDVSIDSVIPEVVAAGSRVIVLSADPSPERLTALLSQGVHGYLLYDTSPEEVSTGVMAVHRGAMAINYTVADVLVQQWRRLRNRLVSGNDPGSGALTPREREVLAVMVEGLPTKAIARRLGVALKTVENHKIRIFEKLGVRSQAQAVSVAINHGLVDVPAKDPNAATDRAELSDELLARDAG